MRRDRELPVPRVLVPQLGGARRTGEDNPSGVNLRRREQIVEFVPRAVELVQSTQTSVESIRNKKERVHWSWIPAPGEDGYVNRSWTPSTSCRRDEADMQVRVPQRTTSKCMCLHCSATCPCSQECPTGATFESKKRLCLLFKHFRFGQHCTTVANF